ncbi:MAG: argininosuccinate lyase, partial [Oscillospiraceae bacterium]|nr:argininosuccinate lyase [Oscillospiraceae bacterium]
GIPLAYNKDMQEDKEALFDAIDTAKLCVPVFTKMVDTMKINKDVMYKGANGGFTNATDVADYLVKKGVPFREAHSIVGHMVLVAEKKGVGIDELSLSELRECSDLIEDDIYDAISMETCVNGRSLTGGPAPSAVEKAIAWAEERLSELIK